MISRSVVRAEVALINAVRMKQMLQRIEVFILFLGFRFKAARGFDVGNDELIEFDASGFEIDADDELGGLMGDVSDVPV